MPLKEENLFPVLDVIPPKFWSNKPKFGQVPFLGQF